MRFLIVLLALVHTTVAGAQVLEPGSIVRLARTSPNDLMRTGRVDSVSTDSALVRFDALSHPAFASFSSAVPLRGLEKYVGDRTLQRQWAIVGALFGGVVGWVAGTAMGSSHRVGLMPPTVSASRFNLR